MRILLALPWLLASLCWVVLAACDASRDRPTGLSAPPPATNVSVLAPEHETSVKADSADFVVVQATGMITAVEFVITGAASSDTLAWQRVEFVEPQEAVQEAFEVRIPRLETGSHLQIRGVAEDLVGQRHVSRTVVVIVIDCEVFPIACRDL
jgi:hypothetical protein